MVVDQQLKIILIIFIAKLASAFQTMKNEKKFGLILDSWHLMVLRRKKYQFASTCFAGKTKPRKPQNILMIFFLISNKYAAVQWNF